MSHMRLPALLSPPNGTSSWTERSHAHFVVRGGPPPGSPGVGCSSPGFGCIYPTRTTRPEDGPARRAINRPGDSEPGGPPPGSPGVGCSSPGFGCIYPTRTTRPEDGPARRAINRPEGACLAIFDAIRPVPTRSEPASVRPVFPRTGKPRAAKGHRARRAQLGAVAHAKHVRPRTGRLAG